MGKVSPKERESKNSKHKKRLRGSSNKYLKPGTLAQLRYSKASAARSCTDLGRKRVAVLDTKKSESNLALEDSVIDRSPLMLSPGNLVRESSLLGTPKVIDKSPLMLSPVNLIKQGSFFGTPKVIDKSPLMLSPAKFVRQNSFLGTPKTPRVEDCMSESRLESLPMDLLVKILCHLHHDQLRAVFHVSQRIRKAVVIARQFHFNYTTPDRSRQEMLRTVTPQPTEHWPFVSKGDGKGIWMPSPHTPKAPRHGPRPPSRLKFSEMRQVAAVLFPESAFPSRCMVPSALPKPLCKSLASNRVLFYEDELCQAVAQNKLR
ncbi:F-box protein At4g35930 [Quercus lobata]|uniref:F-box domain-containing protein n=1 Tax=Quercus lobata TaxID=97700 RepID=A0A7N2R731_QUELO|nr:F-box protein At4g35930 [Quercus lobata]XP_030924063.1 F-box protein At4g35930 [Quercus lobata]